jgi:thiol-disulfide isomerase/thioredoxin
MFQFLKILLPLVFLNNPALAVDKPDLKALQYTAKKMEGSEFKIKFTPPKDHHFNMEAPSLVKQFAPQIAGEPGVESDTIAKLEKKPSEIIARLTAAKPGCEVKTELYICDDKNTYCLPIKKNFLCEDLMKKSSITGFTSQNEIELTPGSALKVKPESQSLFILNDPATALNKARSEKKILLIDFFGIWCPPCNMLDETVFSTKEFAKMKKDYVFLKMDADAASSFELKSKYNVKGYPTVVLANPQGEEISRIIGSRKAKAFIAEMKNAVRLKSMSLNDRIAKAESQKNPEIAFELAKMYLNQEDFSGSLKYSMLGLKKSSITSEQRQNLLSAQLGLLKETAKDEASQKKLATLIESTLQSDPTGIEAFQRADDLVKIADDLKDEALKSRALSATFKNAEFLLKNPKIYESSESSEGDLHQIMADVYDTLKDEAKMKASYMAAAQAYEREIKAHGLSLDSERGHNLERIYCLYKAGLVDDSLKLYEQMEGNYPEEFTFYYSHASVLKELGKKELALEKAEKALQYSYGDNQLRAVNIVADLRSQLGKKKEAIKLIDETLEKFPPVKDLRIRSGRYIDKLAKLKEQITK